MHKVLPLLIGRSSPSAGIAAIPVIWAAISRARDSCGRRSGRNGRKEHRVGVLRLESSLQSHAFDARSTIRAIEPGNGGVP